MSKIGYNPPTNTTTPHDKVKELQKVIRAIAQGCRALPYQDDIHTSSTSAISRLRCYFLAEDFMPNLDGELRLVCFFSPTKFEVQIDFSKYPHALTAPLFYKQIQFNLNSFLDQHKLLNDKMYLKFTDFDSSPVKDIIGFTWQEHTNANDMAELVKTWLTDYLIAFKVAIKDYLTGLRAAAIAGELTNASISPDTINGE